MSESGDNPSMGPRFSYGLVLLILLIMIGGFIFFQSDFFLLRKIELSGNSSLSKEELLDRTGLNQRINIFQVDLGEYRHRLLNFPEIYRVNLERKLPDTLILHVTERKALCLIPKSDGFYEVGSDGVIIRKRNEQEPINLPVLTGLKNSPSGQPPKLHSKSFSDAQKIVLATDGALRTELSEVDLVHYRLYTTDSIQVELGNTSRIEEKIAALHLLLASNDRRGIIGIDLRVPSQPIVLTDKGVAKKALKK
ncbi:MAG TPA: FtsQ-type POTRA domain-containing protein [Bacillota bacterium]|nr:FtsQ-type POTRA domain-containing protein [Bacillota bacterium]